jgi:hypothetical protein
METDMKQSPNAHLEMRWADMCRAWYALGYMDGFSKRECFKMSNRLKKEIKAGRVRRIKRGVYALTPKALRAAG